MAHSFHYSLLDQQQQDDKEQLPVPTARLVTLAVPSTTAAPPAMGSSIDKPPASGIEILSSRGLLEKQHRKTFDNMLTLQTRVERTARNVNVQRATMLKLNEFNMRLAEAYNDQLNTINMLTRVMSDYQTIFKNVSEQLKQIEAQVQGVALSSDDIKHIELLTRQSILDTITSVRTNVETLREPMQNLDMFNHWKGLQDIVSSMQSTHNLAQARFQDIRRLRSS